MDLIHHNGAVNYQGKIMLQGLFPHLRHTKLLFLVGNEKNFRKCQKFSEKVGAYFWALRECYMIICVVTET